MPVALDQARLVEMSQELLRMSVRGVHVKRLRRLALDLLVGKAAAREVLRTAEGPRRAWATRALRYLGRLEDLAVRMYARAVASERLSHAPALGVGLELVPG